MCVHVQSEVVSFSDKKENKYYKDVTKNSENKIKIKENPINL
jgi:hypothetical protein